MDLAIAIIIVVWKDGLAHFFTANPAIVMHLDLTFDTMAVLIIIQGIHINIGGGLKALGLQSKLSVIVMVSQYIGTIPSGAAFSLYFGHGLRGIWEGLILGGFLQTLMFAGLLLLKVDWVKSARDIHLKMRK